MTARRIRQTRQRIRLARTLTAWNGFVAALLLSVVVTAVILGGVSPSLPVVAALYLAPILIMAAAVVGHAAAQPRHAPVRVRVTRD